LKETRIADEAPVSFFSRLRGERPAREPAGDLRFSREILAIERNLESILNTKKGAGSVVSTFGLGDYEGSERADGEPDPYLGTRAILAVLVPEILDQVRRYEPRIAHPRIEKPGRDGRLRVIFTVNGAVSARPARFRITFDTVYRNVLVAAQTEGLSEEA
jgi:predicted component of type VI protein secretion system